MTFRPARRAFLLRVLPLCVLGAWLSACGADPAPAAPKAAAPAAAPATAHWTTDYDAALAQARAEKKVLLCAFTGSDWCPPCKRLQAEVFDSSTFAAWAALHAVLVEFDFPRGKALAPALKAHNESFAKVLNITKFPTVVLLNAAAEEIGRVGYSGGGPDAFLAEAEARLPKRDR